MSGFLPAEIKKKTFYSLHCMEESLEVKGAAMEASPSFTTCT